MKKNILIIALFAVISTSNATIVADGVELASSTSWITGDLVSGHMEDNHNKLFFSYASAYAAANGGTGRILTNITSSGNHSFRIENTSKNSQTYATFF